MGSHKSMTNFPYLLVKQGEVGTYEGKILMEVGDTLELFTGTGFVCESSFSLSSFTGHVTTEKASRDVYAKKTMRIPGGYLEDVSFCVIRHVTFHGEL